MKVHKTALTIIISLIIFSVVLWAFAIVQLIYSYTNGGMGYSALYKHTDRREYEEALTRNLEHYMEEAYKQDGFMVDEWQAGE